MYSIARYKLCSYFGSMYENSSCYDRDFLIHEIFISWRFHDPYNAEDNFLSDHLRHQASSTPEWPRNEQPIGTNKSISFTEPISSSSHCRRVQTNWKVVFASVFRRSLSRPGFPPQLWINMQLTTSLNKHTGSASAEQSCCDQRVQK